MSGATRLLGGGDPKYGLIGRTAENFGDRKGHGKS